MSYALSEEEAWVVIGAVQAAQAERPSDEETGLVKRLCSAFPAIDRELHRRDVLDQIWEVDCEQDQEVLKIRQELSHAIVDSLHDETMDLIEALMKAKNTARDRILRERGLDSLGYDIDDPEGTIYGDRANKEGFMMEEA